MRFPPHGPGGFGVLGGVFTDILAGLVFIILFIVAVGLLFVLVRFLLVATKAAEVYIAKNGDTRNGQGVTSVAAQPAATSASATPVAAKPTTTTAATPRTRTTKTPPTS